MKKKRGEKLTITITKKNKFYKLVIKLTTNLTSIPTMTFKHIEQQYVTNLPLATYTTVTVTDATLSDGVITYKIPLKNFNEGDILKDFVCTLEGTRNLYDLNEGITILVDGKEEITVNSSTFPLTFQDTDYHTVQAIYEGNRNIGVALSDKLIITPEIDNDPNNITGSYKIEFTKYKKTMKYMDDVEWIVRLTKGGVGVPNVLIQIDDPVSTTTHRTDSEGYVTLKRNYTYLKNNPSTLTSFKKWNVGTYTIQARYHYYENDEGSDTTFNELICSTSEKLTIKKGTPTISVVKYATTKKGTATFKTKDPMGFNMENTKLTEIVNGKTYNKATNAYGNVSFKIGVKGNIKYKIKYAGNKNLKALTKTFSETIS